MTVVTQDVDHSSHYELHGNRCKSWCCEQCCVHRGLKLRGSLLEVLKSWASLMMFTLTVDPKQHESPEAAHEYLKEQRAISRLIDRLVKRGVLAERKYFVVREYQKETKFEHYHVLVEARHVPFAVLAEEWGRFEPKHVPSGGYCACCKAERHETREGADGKPEAYCEACDAWTPRGPKCGHVRFSAPKFADAKHAAHYACKYLIKHPEEGYPEWVTSRERVVRYTTSRGFWGDNKTPELGVDPEGDPVDWAKFGHEPECFCNSCRGHSPPAECELCGCELSITRAEELALGPCEVVCADCRHYQSPPEEPEPEPTAIADRVRRCRTVGVLMKVTERMRPDGELYEVREFVEDLGAPLPLLMERIGHPPDTKRARLLAGDLAAMRPLREQQASKLEAALLKKRRKPPD